MLKKKLTQILCLILVLCFVLPTAVLAAPGDPQTIQYVYFQDANTEMVAIDYVQTINDAILGNLVLYNALIAHVGNAILYGAPVYLETTIGTVLDYQKAISENKPDLVQIQDDPTYQTARPAYTKMLSVVGGVASIVPLTVPAAPAVTNDDTANTVSGMMPGYEYSLDSASYVLYDAVTFAALNFSGIHTLLVRVAAGGVNAAGAATTLNFTTDAVTPPAPAVTNDDTANTVSGMLPGMEYSLDGAAYVAYTAAAFAAINIIGNHTLLVRVAAEGINPAGLITTLTFTTSDVETAELAVSAYESAPISTMDQITSAEALKAPADTAVALVTDEALNAALTARITARTTQIETAKSNLLGFDIAALATAETAVTAFEAAPLANIANVNAAVNLKTTADAKVLLVNDPVAKAAFQARITAKFIAMAIVELSQQTYAPSYDTYMAKYVSVLGIDFTEYNTLAIKLPVQTAMVNATFTTLTQIQTTFNAAVAAQKATETSVVTVFNSAADAAAIGSAITTYAAQLSLTLTEYNAIADKTSLHNELLNRNFTSGEQIKTAIIIAIINNSTAVNIGNILNTNATFLGLQSMNEFSSIKTATQNSVFAAKPIVDKTTIIIMAINNATQYYLGQMIPYFKDILGLDLSDYNALTARNRGNVQNDIVAATMATKTDVQNAFNACVAAKKANEATAVASLNSATTAAEIGTVITAAFTTNMLMYDIADYTALLNKVPVYENLLLPTFTTMTQVEAAIGSAAAVQKALEATAMANINNAAAADIEAAITGSGITLGLNLTDYNALTNKAPVNNTMAVTTFYSLTTLKTTFESAVASQKAVDSVNNADAASMGTVITANTAALGLTAWSITDYNFLSTVSKDVVHTALVGKAFADKAAVKTAFETAIAVPLFDEITTAAAMGTAITNYTTVLGLTTANYTSLTATYKTAVQTALLTPTFLIAADIRTAFDAASMAEKANQGLYYINAATSASSMASYITTYAVALGLDLTEYNTLTNKVPVQTALVNAPAFAAAADFKAVFDTAIAVAKVNEASAAGMGAVLTANAMKLGLDLTDYSALIYKEPVHNALVSPTFTDAAAVKSAFDAAVAEETAFEGPLLNTPAVRLNKPTTSLIIGTSETLIATVLPDSTIDKSVIWSSADSTVATVDSTGLVTAVNGGTTVITATNSDGTLSDTCTVTVIVPVTGVILNKANTSMYVGGSDTLVATVLPANATNKNVVWSTSGPTYATVNNGVVTGVAMNVVTITVTTVDGNFKATCMATVTNLANVLNNFNLATENYIATMITQYGVVVGLDLTDYLTLGAAEKLIVQNAVLNYPQSFTTTAQIKAVFDPALAVQVINTATTATIESMLVKYAAILGINLTAYNQLADKSSVNTYVTSNDYGTVADVRTAFNTAVAVQEINEATVSNMGTTLTDNAAILGLSLAAYDTLTNAEKDTVHGYLMLTSYTYGGYADAANFETAFDQAVINAPEAVIALGEINAALAETFGAALSSNATILGIDTWEYDFYITENPALKPALDAAITSQDFTNQYDLFIAIITFIYG